MIVSATHRRPDRGVRDRIRAKLRRRREEDRTQARTSLRSRRPSVPSRAKHPARPAYHRRQSGDQSREWRRNISCDASGGARGPSEPSISRPTFTGLGRSGASSLYALAERAAAGVDVQVLIDWVGGQKMDDSLLEKMIEAGVKVERFHPLRWYNLGRMNNRTHRKLLIVDGHIGFTGGVGIADIWQGNAQSSEHWRDSHYRLEGPAVAQHAGCVHRQLDQNDWVCAPGRRVFSRTRACGGCARSSVYKLTKRRWRQHASHVSDVNYGRGAHD